MIERSNVTMNRHSCQSIQISNSRVHLYRYRFSAGAYAVSMGVSVTILYNIQIIIKITSQNQARATLMEIVDNCIDVAVQQTTQIWL